MFWGEALIAQINICPNTNYLTDCPSEYDAEGAAQQAHGPGFREEQAANILITCANRFHNADFATPLEHRHDQRVDDANRGDGQCQAAKNEKKHVQDLEKPLQALR